MNANFDLTATAALILGIFHFTQGSMFGGSDRVLLSDIKVLTLHRGQTTKGRRSSPIPQLKCLGGSAQCSFAPETVQCINQGSDGFDVQWECKTDMDNDYRFGRVEVSCEGYDYPEDPYVLRGSCGLEYTIDYTSSGRQKSKHHDYYDSYHSYGGNRPQKTSTFGNLITLVLIGLIIYGIYKTCLSNNRDAEERRDHYGPGSSANQPPPPGFRSEYMPKNDYSSNDYEDRSSYGHWGNRRYNRHGGMGSGLGGFWGGFGTGGMLGYMLGNRGAGYNGYGAGYGTGYGGNAWGSSHNSWGGRSRTGSSFGGSSGSRTASGFGGTSRR